MTVSTIPTVNTRFKIGWIFLLVLTAIMTLGHLILIFVNNEPVLFTGYTAFNLYAFLVLLIPFRQGKKWAWFATWILPVAFALSAYFDTEIAPYYYGLAAVCGLGLLITMRDFFTRALRAKVFQTN